MYSALLYKEWLKIRWALLGMTLLSLLTLTYIALNLAYYTEFMTAKGFWGNVILLGFPFYTEMEYIPAITGIVIGIVQFAPETNQSRLKLTLHLPVEENKLLLQMTSFGFMLLLFLFAIITLLLLIIIGIYFPSEVITNVLNIWLPWSVGGLAAYFLTVAVIVEPIWVRRLILIPFALGFIDVFFDIFNQSFQLILFLVTFSLLTSTLVLFSGYHFKRGIK